jgi:sulfite reductase (NADPH) flavoprotein alpha-component
MTATTPGVRIDRGVLGHAVALLALAALCAWFLSLHGWPAWTPPDRDRLFAASAVATAYAFACVLLYRHHRGGDRAAVAGADALRVVHASQTGYAAELAARTAATLADAGAPVRVDSIARIGAAELVAMRRAFFVVSTTGEGDAPDAATGFLRGTMDGAPDLARLEYGLLALGDRRYANFCAFGRRLDDWLRRAGARPLFDAVEVDDGDEAALRHWQHHLGVLVGRTDLPDWSPPRYERWRLHARLELNPGSVGGACFFVELVPMDGAAPGMPRGPSWRAGDLVEIGPRHAPGAVEAQLRAAALDGDAQVTFARESTALRDALARSALPPIDDLAAATPQAIADRLEPLPHREYSIASIPADGAIQLVVRRLQRPDGTPGLGAGWLTQHAPIGAPIDLRIRTNANFHAPDHDVPLILIGNGTGIAGLRALLRERIAQGRRRNWLVFGERNADRDFLFRDELQAWHAQGFIERLDLAFSRDQPERIYVQHRVAAAAADLRDWVAAGACIHVCGSLEGMAPGVHTALVDALGASTVERLQMQGHYRRDVY